MSRHYEFRDGKTLDIGQRTLVMGILNYTPDSFSDGGRWNTIDKALSHMRQMVDDGADIIDVGAESTRPGSASLTPEEEQARLLPLLRELLPACPVPVSVDTYHAETADRAAALGAHILNDIWGLQYAGEPTGAMAAVAARYSLPVIVMHNQTGTDYPGDILDSMRAFFTRSVEIADKAGIDRSAIILDPGIGFGKDTAQNLHVLRHQGKLRCLDGQEYPWLLAASRKRFIGDTLGLPVNERVEATGATCVLGIAAGADIVRVHDVKPITRMCRMADAILQAD